MPSSGFQTCARSEEHTSELQSHSHLVCRLLLEKKKIKILKTPSIHTILRAFTDLIPPYTRTHRFMLILSWYLLPYSIFKINFFFFLKDTATPEIYPLPLHAALPI